MLARCAAADAALRAHRGEEALGAVGIEAGARRDADADAVGLELLGAREVRQRDLGLGERQRAELRIAEQVGGDAVDERGLARLVLADRGVARDHVRHLVRQHRGELGVVVGEREQAAGDVELAGRQREGVDRRRVEDRDLVFQVRPLGGRDQLVDGLLEHRLAAAGRRRRRHRPRGCAGARAARGRGDFGLVRLGARRAAASPMLCGSPDAVARAARRASAPRDQSRSPAMPVRCARSRWPSATTVSPAAVPHAQPRRRRSRSAPAASPRSTGRRAPRSTRAPSRAGRAALRLQPGGRKAALVAFQNRDGEVLRPAPPEIDVDRAAAFAHRQRPCPRPARNDRARPAPRPDPRPRACHNTDRPRGQAWRSRAARSRARRSVAHSRVPIRPPTRANPRAIKSAWTERSTPSRAVAV